MASVTKTEIKIPKEILEEIENLENSGASNKITFLPWHDEVLKKYYKVKRRKDLAKLLKMSTTTLRRRYKEIMA